MKAIRGIGFDYLGVIARDLGGTLQHDQELLALADHLRMAGYRVGLMSNLAGDPGVFVEQKLDQHFDVMLTSGAMGYAKPDPRAFEVLAQRLGVPVTELLFIDDSAASLQGTANIGVTPVLFRDYPQLLVELSHHGVNAL
jgi:putative hydrolase of the HAD superfamily